MNYRDFFKNHKATPKDILRLLPEGVDPDEFKKGISTEKEHTDDEFTAAKIAGDHLKEDPKYYTKLTQAGLEEEEQDEHCGACKDDMGRDGDEYDDNGGLPTVGGALAVPHLGDPIRMSKIIQVGKDFGSPASGEQSGMTACGGKGGDGKGVAKDTGGIPANQPSDKEPITAGGKKVDSSIATKSVGGAVSPGDGQKQGGPNSQGTIASTPKMNEHKKLVRQKVLEVLKEIRFDKEKGKWVRINELAFPGQFPTNGDGGGGKLGHGSLHTNKHDDDPVDRTGDYGEVPGQDPIGPSEEVNMKMGPSYKTVQPHMYQTADMDWARANQYDPEITEMYDEEEMCKMNERLGTLMNAPRNLTETELAEMKTLKEKLMRLEQSVDDYDPQGYSDEDPKAPEEPDTEINPDELGEGKWAMGEYTQPQQQAIDILTKRGFREVGSFPGEPDAEGQGMDNTVTVVMQKKQGPSRLSAEIDPDGSVNGQPVQQFIQGMSECRDAAMKMGPSYRVGNQPQYRCLDCDQAHRNQDSPESTNEAGGQAVQHSSARTVKHGNLPQSGDQRWADDMDESNKPSKVVKTIRKGQKAKKNIPTKTKHEVPRHTTSGVHKRKT